ncbi:uncharacterized protein LOC123898256 [Trifolium pratense]|uniref:uncharacterized protein LOC123898256 n=1 Tax=Trifolium pratense TaxID=57577 RepID=UPI001E698048|nr:uncharacterized protein LOC123898256 [Trifolium pratense]
MKKKRKDDDSSEYLHSSPPTKSRRLLLNSEITMEEDTHANVLLYHPSNFNSNNTPLLNSPTSPGLNDYLLSRDTTKLDKFEEDEMTREKRSEVSKECLAVIPWVPNPLMAWKEIVPETSQILEAEDSEMMEMDEPYANNNNGKLEACGVSSARQQQQCMMANMLQPQFGTYFW